MGEAAEDAIVSTGSCRRGTRGENHARAGKMNFQFRGLWVRLFFIPAIIWIGVGIVETGTYSMTFAGKVELLGYTVLGFVAIIGLGLGVQWFADYIAGEEE